MSAARALLGSLPPLTLVVGKGGTGKTTLSLGLAAHLARAGRRTLVLSTDPAGTLGDAIGVSLGSEPRHVSQPASLGPGDPMLEVGKLGAGDHAPLDAQQLSADTERRRFLARWRDVVATIIDRGTYLDSADIAALVDATFPGADETFALLALATLVRDARYDRVVVDTAPAGHTLRLLALPRTFDALVALLETMQEKHRFMVRALTHRYRRDRADELLDELRDTIGALRGTLADSTRSAAVVVARAEAVVAAETTRLAEALGDTGVAIAAVIVNAFPPNPGEDARRALDEIAGVAPAAPHFVLPLRAPDPGVEGAASLLEALARLDAPSARAASASRPEARVATPGSASARPTTLARRLVRELTIVGGKGGVGKTTTSCALALVAAEAGERVLLVSTDPAPSIADALGQPIGDEETEVAGVPQGKLLARQIDAAAAFQRFRLEYESRVDALFTALTVRGMDATYDRAIARDVLALTPPGIDEVYALSSLGETLASERYTHVVVDPAPTGHLLRLLEMPALAVDWSRQLMRLMLKYKDVVGLGETAQELVAFSRRTRMLEQLMHNRARTGLVVVALDEPLVRGETQRLIAAVRALGVDVIALLWNRAAATTHPLPSDGSLEQVVTPARLPPPIGVAAIREWSRDWYSLAPH